MALNIQILSKRQTETWPSWHLVYEWEDVMAKDLNIPIVTSSSAAAILDNRYVQKILSLAFAKTIAQRIDSLFRSKTKHISFEIRLKRSFSYSNNINAIPIIIDFYKNKESDQFYQTYRNSSLICVTSIEVFNYLLTKNYPLNIKHLPLSLPDQYKLSRDTVFEKEYTLILAGRRNPTLWSYLNEYLLTAPDLEFLYQENINGELVYVSNKKGIIGKFNTREEYMNLLKKCKIAFYSTPGIDGEEHLTGGFSQVTPRYLELLSSGCLVLGRYKDNAETAFYDLDRFCPNVQSIDQFSLVMNSYMSTQQPDIPAYSSYLEQHYTSVRSKQLQQYIKDMDS